MVLKYLILWLSQWMSTLIIKQKKIATDSEGKTVLRYFLDNATGIKNVIWLQGLETAAPTVATYDSNNMAIAWKNSADKLVFDLPMPFTQEDLLQDGLKYTVPCRAKTAGVTIFYPKVGCKGLRYLI